jgi:putative heme-binding domain-containing protein
MHFMFTSRWPFSNAFCVIACFVFIGLVSWCDAFLAEEFEQTPEVMATAASVGRDRTESTDYQDWLAKGPRPKWIWGTNENQDYVVTKVFEAGVIKKAILSISCDNRQKIYINDQVVGESSDWSVAMQADVSKFIKVGKNTIRVEVANEGGIAAMVSKLVLLDDKGELQTVESDESWLVAERKTPDKTTAARVVANYGAAPWGQVFSNAGGDPAKGQFLVPEGFQIEKLFTVPRDELGSWVCITADNKGRLIVSDQENKGLCRITPAPVGSKESTKVEKLDVAMSGAQGLLYAFDSLYVCANGGPGSGLYRLKDTDGDDQFDEVKKLFAIRGGGEHGPHALRLSPDGKSIFVCAGNHTLPPMDRKLNTTPQTMGGSRSEQLESVLPEGMTSRIAPVWDEDLLLPRQWDSNGHAAGIVAPGGWIAKTDPEGKTWEMFTVGYRNQYDFDFNADGEMFVYDSDMEWDMGTPWYRPTRVLHATSGSEFGWRSGTGNWPAYYVDSLPELVNIGPGSPVGVQFGYGTKFPAKYQKALFICDWTFGTMYAIHMVPSGASYTATKEEFVARTPLPLTDVTVGKDGALYFTVGGRGTQSELYRVTYVGTESTAAVDCREQDGMELRTLRSKLELFHHEQVGGKGTEDKLAETARFLIPYLGHDDLHIRYAARVGLERIPVKFWATSVLNSADINTRINGIVGLARVGGVDLQDAVLESLNKLDWKSLSPTQQLDFARTYQLALIRLGTVSEQEKQVLQQRLGTLFPSGNEKLDRELAILNVFLETPGVAKKITDLLARERSKVVDKLSNENLEEVIRRNRGYGSSIAAMLANQPDLEQIHMALTLRNLKSGWTVEQREIYFQWFGKAINWDGGNSYKKFLSNISDDAYATTTDVERFHLEAVGARKSTAVQVELPKPEGPGKAYSVEELLGLTSGGLRGRNFENGKKMYSAARCVICHRYGNDGGATGPDLTQAAGRFAVKDLIEAIVDPSRVISDQYKTTVISTSDGEIITGRIVRDDGQDLVLATDPEIASKTVKIARKDIEEQKPSAVSLMPRELLNGLNQDEVLDLLAYVLSRGNPSDAVFKR